MSQTVEPSFVSRLRYTPMRDLVRLRATGRLNVKWLIQSSGLPIEVQSVVARVVRRTRLWPLERSEVAQELITHFLDALAAGVAAEDSIRAFGDPKVAAKLIRRAKVRNRPIVWHALRGAWVGVLICLALYCVSGLYFLAGRPSPRVDYTAEFNRHVEAIPTDQRAWPVYRRIHEGLYDHTDPDAVSQFQQMIVARPGDSGWPRLAEWVNGHQDSISSIWPATRRDSLGILFRPDGHSQDPLIGASTAVPAPIEVPMHNAMLDPSFDAVLNLAQLLVADANLATNRHDDTRLMEDLRAAVGIARQLQESRCTYASQCALWIRQSMLNVIDDTLTRSPATLSDNDLQELAHLLAKPDSASDIVQLDALRLVLLDLVQRMYTDGGHCDGRLTPQGLAAMKFLSTGASSMNEVLNSRAMSPAYMLVGPSRRQTVARIEKMIEEESANLRRPMRQIDPAFWNARTAQVRPDPLAYLTRLPLLIMDPRGAFRLSAERYLGERDGTLVGLALELYRRHHGGEYPESLAALAPGYLPLVPDDRVVGGPLHYRLADGSPVIYSFGDDQDDDSGTVPASTSRGDWEYPGTARTIAAFRTTKRSATDGDWIVFPIPSSQPQTSR